MFLGFVRRPGTTRAGGPRGARVRGANRNGMVAHRARAGSQAKPNRPPLTGFLPLVCRQGDDPELRHQHRQGGKLPEPCNSTPMAVNPISPGSPHVRPMGVHRTCGEADEIKKNTHPENVTALYHAEGQEEEQDHGQRQDVRVPRRSIPPPWRAIRFRLALRTYAPCGPSVRVVSQTKSRKIPTSRDILPLCFVIRYDTVPDAVEDLKDIPMIAKDGKPRQSFNSAQNGGQIGFARSPARTPNGAHVSPRWGSVQLRLALRTYVPWGLRAGGLAESRKMPTRNIFSEKALLNKGGSKSFRT